MEEKLSKVHYVPMSTMKRVLDIVDVGYKVPHTRCRRNLLDLQNARIIRNDRYTRRGWDNRYQTAVSKAVHSHDWDKLLYLLKKSPLWERAKDNDSIPLYIRAMTVLLMYHPAAQNQALFNEYIHLVLSCRTNEDKKALLKVLLTLPEKFPKIDIKCKVKRFQFD